jgi:AcrR family transcriptional regulator
MSTKRQETRDRLLDEARRLFASRGIHGVGLEEVAAAAGVSRQAIYQYHFRSKAELLLAVLEHVNRSEGVAALVQPIGEASSGESALDALVEGLAKADERIGDIARSLEAARVVDPAAEAAWQERMALRRGSVRHVVRLLMKEGRLAPGWTVDAAEDFMFACVTPGTFRTLTHDCAWSRKKYVGRMQAALRKVLQRDA